MSDIGQSKRIILLLSFLRSRVLHGHTYTWGSFARLDSRHGSEERYNGTHYMYSNFVHVVYHFGSVVNLQPG